MGEYLEDLEQFFKNDSLRLVRYLRKLESDPAIDAEDMAQMAYIKAVEKQPQNYNGSVKNWVYSIARNIARDAAKAKSRHAQLLTPGNLGIETHVNGTEDRYSLSEKMGYVRRAMSTINPTSAEVVRKTNEGFSYEETAQAMGINPRSVGQLRKRGLEYARKALIREGVYDALRA